MIKERTLSFKFGFEIGFKLVKGNSALLPLTPLAPITPMGSTAFREGLKAGFKAGGAVLATDIIK